MNEYAHKLHVEQPTYNNDKQLLGGVLPAFITSLVFNGTSYTGGPAGTKKDVEQSAAKAAILSIMSILSCMLYYIFPVDFRWQCAYLLNDYLMQVILARELHLPRLLGQSLYFTMQCYPIYKILIMFQTCRNARGMREILKEKSSPSYLLSSFIFFFVVYRGF